MLRLKILWIFQMMRRSEKSFLISIEAIRCNEKSRRKKRKRKAKLSFGDGEEAEKKNLQKMEWTKTKKKKTIRIDVERENVQFKLKATHFSWAHARARALLHFVLFLPFVFLLVLHSFDSFIEFILKFFFVSSDSTSFFFELIVRRAIIDSMRDKTKHTKKMHKKRIKLKKSKA